MDYMTISTEFLRHIKPLDEAERGRLFAAMLIYAKEGQSTDLPGNERFIWPTAKLYIDRGRDVMCRIE